MEIYQYIAFYLHLTIPPSRRLARSSSQYDHVSLLCLRLSAPFTRMSLFGLLGAGSGSSTIRSPFVILSHSLARLERMRSNLPPPHGGERKVRRTFRGNRRARGGKCGGL